MARRRRLPFSEEAFDEDLDRQVDDLISYPIEERIKLLDELDVGAIPGDEAVRERILKGHKDEVLSIARERVGHGLHREPKFGRTPPAPYDPSKRPLGERIVDPTELFRPSPDVQPVQDPFAAQPESTLVPNLPRRRQPDIPAPEEAFAPPAPQRGSDEAAFQAWYRQYAAQAGVSPNPDDPKHQYDYRGLYRAILSGEAEAPGPQNDWHGDSRFKSDTHPNRFVDTPEGLLDTKYGKVIGQAGTPPDFLLPPQAKAQLEAAAAGKYTPKPLSSYEPIQPLSFGEAYKEFGKATGRGAGHLVGSLIKSPAIIVDEMQKIHDDLAGHPLNEYKTYQLGQAVSDWADKTFEGRKDLQQNFLLKTVPEALGSSLPFYLLGAAGAAQGVSPYVTAGIPGALAGITGAAERAGEAVQGWRRHIGILLGAMLGSTEAVPIAEMFQNMDRITGGALKRAIAVGTLQAIEEAVQEGVQQLGENAVAKYIFQHSAEGLWDGVGEGMLAGAVVGFLTGGIAASSGIPSQPAYVPKPGGAAPPPESTLFTEPPPAPPGAPPTGPKVTPEKVIEGSGVWVEPPPAPPQPAPIVPPGPPVGEPPPAPPQPAVVPEPAPIVPPGPPVGEPPPVQPVAPAPAPAPVVEEPAPLPPPPVPSVIPEAPTQLPVILGVDLNELTGTEPEVEAAMTQYAVAAAGFDPRRGRTVGVSRTLRTAAGTKLWEDMSRLERMAEFRQALLQDVAIAQQEAGDRPAEYLLNRALDPLDPMSVAYREILRRAGAEITPDGGIKLPKEFRPKPGAVDMDRLLGLMNMARQSATYEEFLQQSNATPEELAALAKHVRGVEQGRKLWAKLREEFTGIPGTAEEAPQPAIGGEPTYGIGDAVEWVDEGGRRRTGTVKGISKEGELEIEEDRLTAMMAAAPGEEGGGPPPKTVKLKPGAVRKLPLAPGEVPNVPATPIPAPAEAEGAGPAGPPVVVGPAGEGAPAPAPAEGGPAPGEGGPAGPGGATLGGPGEGRPGGPGEPGGRPELGPGGRQPVSVPTGRAELPEPGPVRPTDELKPSEQITQPEGPTHGTTRHDFRIAATLDLEAGGPKAKFERNLAAIKLLQQIESEGRLATPDEQRVLAQYVGWGGMREAFDRWNKEWSTENERLRNALTTQEYDAAEESSVNAHYTTPAIASAIHRGLASLGFRGGRMLEPAIGTGIFFGTMQPAVAAQSMRAGVEMDDLSVRLARQLYQNTAIEHLPYEKVIVPENFYDVIVGNVPFSEVTPYDANDRELDRKKFVLHDYFIAKSVKSVRPGGLVVFITSSGTMDKTSERMREYVGGKANLVGAIRLPNNAFQKIANTRVMTDILVFQKRKPGTPPVGDPWLKLKQVPETGFYFNQYFVDHPEMVLGTAKKTGDRWNNQALTIESDGRDIGEAIREAFARLPRVYMEAEQPASTTQERLPENLPAPKELREGNLTISEDKAMQVVNGKLVPLGRPVEFGTPMERLRGLIGLRTKLRASINAQLEHDYATADGKALIDAAIKDLNTAYDQFFRRFGRLHDRSNVAAFFEDPDMPLVMSLEVNYNPKTREAEKSDALKKPTLARRTHVTTADTAKDALLVSLNENGRIDLEHMQRLTGKTEDVLMEELVGLIYLNPEGSWEMADAYLSGDVRQKLRIAEAAAKVDPRYKPNVEALRTVQPKDLVASEVSVLPGAGWVPTDVVAGFFKHLLRVNANVKYNAEVAAWSVDYRGVPSETLNHVKWGTPKAGADWILDQIMHGRQIIVRKTIRGPDGKKKRVVDETETTNAQAKAEAIIKEWQDNYLFKEEERAKRLLRIYNDTYNNLVERKYDGSHLTLPGTNPGITLRPHQKNVIWRAMQSPSTYVAHVVGSGKTMSGVAIALESRRLGLSKKPLIVVPNAVLLQWKEEARRLYPAAKLLTATPKDLSAQNRKEFTAKIATGDWDAVIMAHSSFVRIPSSLASYESLLGDQIRILREYIESEGFDPDSKGGREPVTVRELRNAIKRLVNKLNRMRDSHAEYTDDTLYFEQLGVDQLIVDEADAFKNLFFVTRKSRIAGIPNSDTDRSFDMLIKTRVIQQNRGGKGGLVFMSGTPVSNSMGELFTTLRYLSPYMLDANQLAHFDAWAKAFGREKTSVEMDPTGQYKPRIRFAQFVNLPELMHMTRQYMDIKLAEDVNLPVPKLKGGKPENVTLEPSETLKAYMQHLVDRVDMIKKGGVPPSVDNMLKICHDGRLAALDVRLRVKGAEEEANSKIMETAKLTVDAVKRYEKVKGTVMIFLDMSTPKSTDRQIKLIEDADGNPIEVKEEETETAEEQREANSVYQDLKNKLIKLGMKPEQIAFIHEAKRPEEKAQLVRRFNEGSLRVMIGSTEKLGTGTNAQQRLVKAIHADQPWRPRDLEQREGRIRRPGNKIWEARLWLESGQEGTPTDPVVAELVKHPELVRNFEIEIARAAVKAPSFDLYMWQLLESKSKFINQVMRGDDTIRTMEDVDLTFVTAEEMKAILSNNPLAMEKVVVDGKVRKLSALKKSYNDTLYDLKKKLASLPDEMRQLEAHQKDLEQDIAVRDANPDDPFKMIVDKVPFEDKKQAGEALVSLVQQGKMYSSGMIGEYRGFTMEMRTLLVATGGAGMTAKEGEISLSRGYGHYKTKAFVRESPEGAIQSIAGALRGLEKQKEGLTKDIADKQQQAKDIQAELDKGFEHEEELREAVKRQQEIYKALGILSNDNTASSEDLEDEDDPGDFSAPYRTGIWTDLPIEMKATRKGETRAVAAVDPSLVKTMSGNLYTEPLAKVAIKEAIQNAKDAVSQTDGKVEVEIDNTTNTLTIKDNGSGMTPAVAMKEFVDIGGSLKPEDSAGGFGMAKVAIFARALKIDVKTTAVQRGGKKIETHLTGSGQDWANPKVGLKVEQYPVADTAETGTSMTVQLEGGEGLANSTSLKHYKVDGYIADFQQYNLLRPGLVTFKVDGELIAVPKAPMTKLTTLTIPGAKIDIYQTNNDVPAGRQVIKVLNRGLPQFEKRVWFGGEANLPLPEAVVADVHATGDPREEGYPFTPDRERLQTVADSALDRYVMENLIADRAERERQRYVKVFTDSAPVQGLLNADQRPLAIVETSGLVADSFVKQLANRPYMKPLLRELNAAFDAFRAKLIRIDEETGYTKSVYAQAEFAGIGTGAGYLAVNVSGRMLSGVQGTPNKILVNPYTTLERILKWDNMPTERKIEMFAARLSGSIVHELTHQPQWAHGSEYAGELTDNAAYTKVPGVAVDEAIIKVLSSPSGEPAAPDLLPEELGGGQRAEPTVFAAIAADLDRLKVFWADNKGDILKPIVSQYAGDGTRLGSEGTVDAGPEGRPRPQEPVRGLGVGEAQKVGAGAAVRGGRPTNVRALADLTQQEAQASIRGGPKNILPRIPVDPIYGGSPLTINEIAKRLQKGLRLRARYSTPARNSIGTYYPGTAKTVVRYHGDLDTMAHELAGHAQDDRFGLVADWAHARQRSPFDKELEHFWWYGSAARSGPRARLPYKRAEGVAEYIRAWVMNPTRTEAQAPLFTAHFKQKMGPETLRILQQFSVDVRTLAGASAHERIMANVRWWPEESPLAAKILGPRHESGNFELGYWDNFMTAWQDRLRPFMRAIDYVRQWVPEGQALLPENDPAILARLVMGIHKKMDTIFKDGMINAKGEITLPGGFRWVLEPLDNSSFETMDKDAQNVVSYMLSMRQLEKSAELKRDSVGGWGAGLDTDTSVSVKRIADIKSSSPGYYARIEEAASRYRQWADANLQYLAQKGRISWETYDDIKNHNEWYIAMQRVMEVAPDEPVVNIYRNVPTMRSIATPRQPFHDFRGSQRAIENPYAMLMESTYRTIQEADRNQVMQAFLGMVQGSRRGMYEGPPQQFADIATKAGSRDKNVITVFVDGKRQRYQIHLEPVFLAMKGIGDTVKLGYWGSLAAVPATVLKNTVVYAPPFAFRNWYRDAYQRTVVSDVGTLPWDSLREMRPHLHEAQELALAGGDQAGWYLSSKEHYYDRLKQEMRDIAAEPHSYLVDPRKLGRKSWQLYKTFMEHSERAGRMAEYKAAYEYARQTLGYNHYNATLYGAAKARDLLDFAVAGNTGEWVNRFVVFMNPAIQALTKAGRAFNEHPARFMSLWSLYILSQTLIVMAWNMLQGDDDEEKKLSPFRQDAFVNIKLGPDNWLSLPGAFEMQVLAAGVKRSVRLAKGDKHAFDGYAGSLARSMIPFDEAFFTGTFIPGLAEAFFNYDVMRGRHIVPAWEENLDIELRKGVTKSSRLGQAIQKVVGLTGAEVDPRLIDHFIQAQFGYFGRYALQASDIGRPERHTTALQWLGLGARGPGWSNPDVQWIFETADSRGVHAADEKAVRGLLSVGQTTNDSKRLGVLRNYLDQLRDAETPQQRDEIGKIVRQEAEALRSLWEQNRPETKKYRKEQARGEHGGVEHGATSALRDLGLLP